MYNTSKHDIIQQFIENEPDFDKFILYFKGCAKQNNPQKTLDFFASKPHITKKTIDKWRLLLKRIANEWYNINSFDEKEMSTIEEVERALDEKLLGRKRFYEGLSVP
jgi:hypothetical protein